jgi:glycosyltransferase involved in cell wall biosynthesis
MRIAFIRVHKDPSKPQDSAARESSSSKGIIAELERQGVAQGCEEWRFSPEASNGADGEGLLPIRTFRIERGAHSWAPLQAYITQVGAPDVVWVEGSDCPPHLRQVFELCPSSLKVVYSKDWKPQKIEGLPLYDLCLADEEWQVEKLARQGVHAAVWDKLIDYDVAHRPIECEKRYDICYVGYLRRRKNHELLFRAMAKVSDRAVTCVCVGGDPDGRLGELQALVDELGIGVDFVGDVPKADVNRHVDESRIGVICSREDAAPRALLEYLAADVPVLANSELLAGARYVGPRAGLVRAPDDFPKGIVELLDNLDDYSPRAHLLEHFSRERVIAKFAAILRGASAAAGKDISLGALTTSGAGGAG